MRMPVRKYEINANAFASTNKKLKQAKVKALKYSFF